MIESTGVAALAVHGRYMHCYDSRMSHMIMLIIHAARNQKERSRNPCHYDVIREVARTVSIQVIAK